MANGAGMGAEWKTSWIRDRNGVNMGLQKHLQYTLIILENKLV